MEEHEHFEDCFSIAIKLYTESKFEEALEVIKDSGLDFKNHYQLGEIRYNCLVELGQTKLANESLAQNCIEVAVGLMRNLKFKDALHQIETSGLDFTSHSQLSELHNLCSIALEGVPRVRELAKEVYKLHNADNHKEALALIEGCRFNLDIHLNLLDIKTRCLKKLGRGKGKLIHPSHSHYKYCLFLYLL